MVESGSRHAPWARTQLDRLEAIFRLAPVGIGIVDLDGRTTMANETLRVLLGYTPEEFAQMAWVEYTHADDVAPNLDLFTRMFAGDIDHFSLEKRFIRKDGSLLWASLTSSMVYDEDRPDYLIGMVQDISERKRLEERLAHQAFHDALTGLPNRLQFHERVRQALERLSAEGWQVTVLFIDLDRFKTVNDTFGHARGDDVIASAALRINACVRGLGTAARLGGDEFALLLEGLSADRVGEVADRVLETLTASPMRIGELAVTVGASIGIADATAGDTADTLLRNADLAMYQAKGEGGGRSFRYRDDLHDQVVQRYQVEEALRAAVAADLIGLVYQPIVDLDTGEISGLEALARWTDPTLGVVSPADFIPAAERAGLVPVLGARLLRQALDDLVRWRAATGGGAYVSVNVSPLQLDECFPSLVQEALDASGLPASALVLEVTEGLLLAESSRGAIGALRRIGVRVAIDDFGTGYSSLSYLRELPVDMVKIDQVFLRPGPSGADDGLLLHALLGLAASLQLTTICEGVETAGQLADLRETGCRFAQGYLLGRPVPLAAVPASVDRPADPPGRTTS